VLLAVDIGNTNINAGVFKGNGLIRKFCFPTKDYRIDKIKRLLSAIDIDAAVICSVVPDKAKVMKEDLRRLLGFLPYIIGSDMAVPVKNLYRNPKQVGADRLVNAYAGIRLYGAPLVVIDFGTAVTFDIVSKGAAYLGGMILPGLRISLEALSEHTALLPKIGLRAPKEFIGRDTKNSMLSGVVYGFALAADALSRKIKGKIGKSAKVIGTGGNITSIAGYCRGIDYIDRDLTLKGINLIYLSKIPRQEASRIKKNLH
jgi:type III pantothenate kinase